MLQFRIRLRQLRPLQVLQYLTLTVLLMLLSADPEFISLIITELFPQNVKRNFPMFIL